MHGRGQRDDEAGGDASVNKTAKHEAARWHVITDKSERLPAKCLITAAGCLSIDNVAEFPNLKSVARLCSHTEQWPACRCFSDVGELHAGPSLGNFEKLLTDNAPARSSILSCSSASIFRLACW